MSVKRVPKKPVGPAMAWLVKLKARRAGIYGKKGIPDDILYRLAGLVTLVGEPGNQEGGRAFRFLANFLLHMRRPTAAKLKSALDAIPPDREKILHVVRGLAVWEQIVGTPITRENCSAERVIGVILEVPDPEPYVRHLVSRNLTALGAVYHPNTLRRAKKELRGLFSGTDGSDGYWERTKDQLEIVDE